jgi:hypothetical protein
MMFAKHHVPTNQTFLAVGAIRSYDDLQIVNSNVTYENTSVVKRDSGTVSWGEINYVSYRIDYENRAEVVDYDGQLPDNYLWPQENCLYTYNDEVTEEMDLTMQRGEYFYRTTVLNSNGLPKSATFSPSQLHAYTDLPSISLNTNRRLTRVVGDHIHSLL